MSSFSFPLWNILNLSCVFMHGVVPSVVWSRLKGIGAQMWASFCRVVYCALVQTTEQYIRLTFQCWVSSYLYIFWYNNQHSTPWGKCRSPSCCCSELNSSFASFLILSRFNNRSPQSHCICISVQFEPVLALNRCPFNTNCCVH